MEGIVWHNRDCMEVIPFRGDKHYGLGFFDTQYGIKEDGRRSASRSNNVLQKNGTRTLVKSNHESKGWDGETMSPEYWEIARRITEVQIIFGVNYLQQNIPYVQMDWGYKPPRREQYDDFLQKNPIGFIIWDKVNGGNDFGDCEVIWIGMDIPSYIIEFMWNGMLQAYDITNGRKQQGNKKLNQKRIHPTEKPLPLLRHFIQKYGVPGKPNLDTHAGSGIFLIACYEEGYSCEAFEIDKGYYTDGQNRYTKHTAKQKLF